MFNIFFPKGNKKFLAFSFAFIFVLLATCSVFALDVIQSDWELEPEEDKKLPISMTEFSTRQEKLEKLQKKKIQEEKIMEELKADISRRRKKLIECMNQQGVTLFSNEDCEACKVQKAYFGDDFASIQYVDCNQARFTCPFRGIKSYPTWYLGSQLGVKKEGVKDLPTLARLTHCEF